MKHIKRIALYFLGMILLSTGIVINSKTNLGVSPIVSISYCCSEVFRLNFPNTTLLLYAICFLIEMIIKGKRSKWFDVLQLPFCFLQTRAMSLFLMLLPNPETMATRILCMIAGAMFTGAGVAFMVSMRIVPNPPDGLVQAISDRSGRRLGLCKNAFDITCVVITIAIGLLAAGKVIGIGIGTVFAVFFVGRFVAVAYAILGKYLDKTAADAPISFLGE